MNDSLKPEINGHCPVHSAMDFMVGIVRTLAPMLLDFSGLDAGYYQANATILTVISFHKPEPARNAVLQPSAA
tara:strand:- start:94918 stop:95136 length:219 start_codon:yes stop_codon:yes gene_type:complete